ncbi:MAG: RNA polymerase sigma factor [Candidatus Nomurabacteria bacterium]|nr:MAG: RNA polymerase sigma factor [Candidatus Nomurabacteria bacterium]
MPDPAELSDEELVVQVRERDQELYRFVVERYEERLRRYALTLVKDPDRAEDVLQSAFIKAFVNLQGFQVKKKFSSWIYRIVHNEAMNELKKHKREVSIDETPEVHVVPDTKESAQEKFERKEIRRMLERCLDKLDIKYREPLILFYFQDLVYEEIRDVLHIPIGTVGTRINRGKKLLKTLYERETQAVTG